MKEEEEVVARGERCGVREAGGRNLQVLQVPTMGPCTIQTALFSSKQCNHNSALSAPSATLAYRSVNRSLIDGSRFGFNVSWPVNPRVN